jgi:anti-sigma-K factor RskA
VTCREWPALGAYALGALEPDERARVDEHLRACPVCAAELAEFEALPGLLDRVRPEDLEVAPVPPSADLFDRVAAAARTPVADRPAGRRSGTRWLVAAVAAAVVAVVGGVAAVAVWASRGGEPVYSATAGDIRLTVTATAQENGTALDVTVAGLPPRTDCRLVVVDDSGRHHEAGEWWATYAGEASFRGWTEVDRSALTDVVLMDADGAELVRLRI